MPTRLPSRPNPLRNRQVPDHELDGFVRALLFAVCGDDPHEFTHLCGLGSAAGLLSERGLFEMFQQQVDSGASANAASPPVLV